MTIRVLIVDDSALIRNVLQAIVNEQPDMQVVGMAADAFAARDMVRDLKPDVITLDVEMPKLDGVTFLQQLMQVKPTPVIMVSTHTAAGSDITFRALESGAVDFVTKPAPGSTGGQDYGELIAYKIRAAASARVEARATPAPGAQRVPARKPAKSAAADTPHVVFIGASTGGTQAIQEVLQALPASGPPVLIVQHMPENFSQPFARRLDSVCEITVKEAEDGEPVLPGHAYVGPAGRHLLIRKASAPRRYTLHLADADPVNLHKPSIDILFRSAAKRVGAGATGVILTGMGKDGVAGLMEMKQAGARTIAQDESSCVVFGTPGEAIRLGAAGEVLPLGRIGPRLCELAKADS
jgi:two-component system chemotaxis response regulator CheB